MLTPYTSASSTKIKKHMDIYTQQLVYRDSHMHLVGQLTTTMPPTKPKSKKENSMQGIYLIKKQYLSNRGPTVQPTKIVMDKKSSQV